MGHRVKRDERSGETEIRDQKSDDRGKNVDCRFEMWDVRCKTSTEKDSDLPSHINRKFLYPVLKS
jgi:hypothetical protein